jgi:transposase
MTARLLSSPQKLVAGESPMIDFTLGTAVHARFRRGQGKRTMARELGLERKTVKRLLAQARPAPDHRLVPRPSVVTPYLAYIQRRAAEVDSNAYRMVQELQAPDDPGGDEMVKLAGRPLRAERDRLAEATMRVETAPGRHAHVDWGTTWAHIGAARVRVPLWVRVLGYSRRLDVECTREQRAGTRLAWHQHACDWCGGLTEEILSDHAKTVVLKREWDGRAVEWHPQGWDFAQHDGLTPRLCRPSRAQTKGQVESSLKDGKRSFVQGRPFPTWEALNPSVHEWVLTGADRRLHGTTFRRPAEAVGDERLRSPLGRPPDGLQTSLLRLGGRDGLVTVDTNRDSVPAAYVGPGVEVQWGPGETVQLYHQGTLMASHPRPRGQHQLGGEPAHYAALHPRPSRPTMTGHGDGLRLASWTAPFPAVAVRALTGDEARCQPEVGHA